MNWAQTVKYNHRRTLNVCCLHCFYSFDSGHVSESSHDLGAMEEVELCQGR